MDTEIGHIGYSIVLKTLPAHFLESIRSELYVKPIENPNFQGSDPFPVFRLSKTKVYVPRNYGLTQFGVPRKYTLPSGDSITIPFEGTLRDIQQQTIDDLIRVFTNNLDIYIV